MGPPRRCQQSGSAPEPMEASGWVAEEQGGWWCGPRWRKERRRSWRWKQWCEEGRGPRLLSQAPTYQGALPSQQMRQERR